MEKRSFAHTETDTLQYIVTTPTGFAPEERLPLIVFLHGAGERGSDLDVIRVHGIPKLFTADPDYHGLRVITLSPQCPADDVWNTHVHALHALIEQTIAQYHADPDRVTITGMSMGGFGTWEMACRYPELFAAAAPVCGGGMVWRAGALRHMPIRAFHGDCDSVVLPEYSLEMVRAVNAAGGHAELTLYPGVGHNSWENVYDRGDVIEWLAAQKRS